MKCDRDAQKNILHHNKKKDTNFLIKNVKHEIQHIFLTVRGRKVQYVCAIVRSNFLNIAFQYKNKYFIFWIMILMFFCANLLFRLLP